MELIADILLVAGALGAGLYCFVLARRLKRFTDLEKGVGGAVSVLSAQAEELRKSLDAARAASDQSGQQLQGLTERAESVAKRLELIMASMHDVVPATGSDTGKNDEPPQPDDLVRAAEPPAAPAESVSNASETGEADVGHDEAENGAGADEGTAKSASADGDAEPKEEPDAKNDLDTDAAEAKPMPKGVLFFRHTVQRGEARK